MQSCAAYGVKTGVYYSVNRNAYLNVWDPGAVRPGAKPPLQAVITQAQYADIVLQQLAELWGNYGSLAEIWFDVSMLRLMLRLHRCTCCTCTCTRTCCTCCTC